jgi:hypothetical protein
MCNRTERMRNRAHVKPSACVTERMRNRAHAQPSACATERSLRSHIPVVAKMIMDSIADNLFCLSTREDVGRRRDAGRGGEGEMGRGGGDELDENEGYRAVMPEGPITHRDDHSAPLLPLCRARSTRTAAGKTLTP